MAALADAFSEAEVSPPAMAELKRSLSAHVSSKKWRSDVEGANRLQDELLKVYKQEVEPCPAKLGLLVTVLEQLRPALMAEDDLVQWFELVIIPFTLQPGAKRACIDDAQDFVVGAMVYDDDAPEVRDRARTCARLAKTLLDAYMVRTSLSPTDDHHDVPVQIKAQAAQYLQSMLVAFGRKKAKVCAVPSSYRPPRLGTFLLTFPCQDLFLAIDNYLILPRYRFQALGLLAAFVEQRQAHLHLVGHTAVVEHLLKSLMNDTATVVVSAALRCLIMLLPHIPATVAAQLPRLFLVYSRCLCWEKFSASSTKAQRDLVTDERVRRGSESEDSDDGHMISDPTWSPVHPMPDMPESSAPELLHYFTYLYALYPLNFMAYVRKPRKYLKNVDFPGADDFDLDQAVIRSRTEQFQRVHLLHSSFFNATLEDELTDNRWLRAEPSDVIAECHALYVGQQVVIRAPMPPPVADLPPLPTLLTQGGAPPPGPVPSTSVAASASTSPLGSVAATPEPGSPVQAPFEEKSLPNVGGPHSPSSSSSQDVYHLQRELTLLRNELTFERYLKHQHVAAIAQLRRNHIKAVTIEAETATLINANRALQKKLGDANKFNEKMQKETQARRTHTKHSEEQLTAKIRSLKADLANQESLQRDLQQARKDCEQLRQLLVESEARELAKQESLESLQDKAREADELRQQVSELTRQSRMHRQHESQLETSQAEQHLTEQELDSTRLLLNQRNQEYDRSNRALQAEISDLEMRLELATDQISAPLRHGHPDFAADLQANLTFTRTKLVQVKTAYSQLLNEYTDLKVKYQELVTNLNSAGHSPVRARTREQAFVTDYRHHDGSFRGTSPGNPRSPYRQEPRVDRYAPRDLYTPTRPVRPDAFQQRLMFDSPMSRGDVASFGDGSSYSGSAAWDVPYSTHGSVGHGPTPPDTAREYSRSAFSFNSEDTRSSTRSGKIKAKSEVRVYGRGL